MINKALRLEIKRKKIVYCTCTIPACCCFGTVAASGTVPERLISKHYDPRPELPRLRGERYCWDPTGGHQFLQSEAINRE